MHNTKYKPLASLRYARTTKTLQEEAGAYTKLKNVDPSTTHPSSTCTDTKKEKSQLNEPNTVDTYLRYTRILITNRILRVCVIKTYRLFDVESTARVDTCTS